jgi:L-threonylcarbamoyladenylate synthase
VTTPPGPSLTEARRALADGSLVVYPTDTVYGLGCDAGDPDAVRRLFATKGLDEDRGVSVLFATRDEARAWADWTDTAEALARAFLPGPITIVLDPADHVPDGLAPDQGTVALRVVDRDEAIALARTRPVVATSANTHGEPTARTVEDAREAFGDEVGAYVDGGRLAGSASTVVDARGERPTVIREGPLGEVEILEAAKRG